MKSRVRVAEKTSGIWKDSSLVMCGLASERTTCRCRIRGTTRSLSKHSHIGQFGDLKQPVEVHCRNVKASLGREMSQIHWEIVKKTKTTKKPNPPINKCDGRISLTFCCPLTRWVWNRLISLNSSVLFWPVSSRMNNRLLILQAYCPERALVKLFRLKLSGLSLLMLR